MKTALRKMLFVDLMKGLKVTFRNQDPKEAITEQYPLQRPQVAERFRGAPRLNNNPNTNETLMHRLRSVRLGVSGEPDRGGQRA